MYDAGFARAQTAYDAAEPEDFETEPRPAELILEDLVATLDGAYQSDDGGPVHPLSDRQATVGIWIDGHEYSLTLNRED